jgi:hypothetical protein
MPKRRGVIYYNSAFYTLHLELREGLGMGLIQNKRSSIIT